MALGWGLWEGPARFIFGPRFLYFNSISLHPHSTQHTVALTFRRSALIYGTDKPSEFVFKRRVAAHRCGERVATVGFTDATLWHF